MKALTKASRINTAIQVLQHMNDGMTVVDACNKVGIPRSTYYHTIKSHPGVVAEYQEMVEANARTQLGMILASNNLILEKVIEDALSEETAPRDRLAIYKVLAELGERISQISRREDEIEANAREFLQRGPTLSKQKSRFTATRETVTIEEES